MADNIIVRVKSRLRVPPAPPPPLRMLHAAQWETHYTDYVPGADDLTIVGTALGIEFDPDPRDLAFVHELTNAHIGIRTRDSNWLCVPMRLALGEHTWPTRLRVPRGDALDITIGPARKAFDLWGYEGAVTFTLALIGAVGMERLS